MPSGLDRVPNLNAPLFLRGCYLTYRAFSWVVLPPWGGGYLTARKLELDLPWEASNAPTGWLGRAAKVQAQATTAVGSYLSEFGSQISDCRLQEIALAKSDQIQLLTRLDQNQKSIGNFKI